MGLKYLAALKPAESVKSDSDVPLVMIMSDPRNHIGWDRRRRVYADRRVNNRGILCSHGEHVPGIDNLLPNDQSWFPVSV